MIDSRRSTVAIAVILIIILIVFWCLHSNRTSNHNALSSGITGLWVGDADFCRKSEIDGIMIYIGKPIDKIHKAYIIMYANNAIIMQKSIELCIMSAVVTSSNNSNLVGTVKITEDEKQDDDSTLLSSVMPSNQTICWQPAIGKMTWTGSDDDTIYAEFYRDNVGSKIGSE
jgi:hypothetical protein